jgi:hypothetical protein
MVEVAVKAGLTIFLGVVLMVSPALADDRLTDVFTRTCLAQFPDFRNIDASPYQPFTRSDADPLARPGVPLITPTKRIVWLAGSPTEKSPDDFALQVSEGTLLDRAAKGCVVVGMAGGEPDEQALLANFETSRFAGETRTSLMPGYRYWLVARGGQQAFFGISRIAAFDKAGLALTLVVPDKAVAQQFADMLADQKN